LDNTELEILYKTHANSVYNLALSYLQNAEDAEETTMDVFLEIHKSAHNFLGNAAISTWVYRIAVNKCLDKIKYKKRQKRDSNNEVSLNETLALTDFIHPGILLENKEKSQILFSAIATLPEKQKTVFLLQQMEQSTNIEIASVLNISVGAVESILHRAKQNLQKKIEKYLNS